MPLAAANHKILVVGLEFIDTALEHLSNKRLTNRELRSTVIHFAVGIELLLKQRLIDEHWSLVFSDAGMADIGSYNSGDFHSVDFMTSLVRLNSICAAGIKQSSIADLNAVRHARNKLLHFGLLDPQEASVSKISKALHVLLKEYLPWAFDRDTIPGDEEALWSGIESKAQKLDGYITERWLVIKDRVHGTQNNQKNFVSVCPVCLQKSLLLTQDRGFVKCFFCECETSDTDFHQEAVALFDSQERSDHIEELLESVRSSSSGEHFILRCPECSKEALVFKFGVGPQSCLYCVCNVEREDFEHDSMYKNLDSPPWRWSAEIYDGCCGDFVVFTEYDRKGIDGQCVCICFWCNKTDYENFEKYIRRDDPSYWNELDYRAEQEAEDDEEH